MKHGRGWRIAAASAVGTSHAKLGTSCQDCYVAKIFTDERGEDVLVVVVSDGAGSAERAEIGSSVVCLTALEAAELFLLDGGTVASLTREVAESWISLVQKAIRLRAADDGAAMRDYACTMLVAVVGESDAAIMQIGDGATVVGAEDSWCWVHWPQHGEFANTTNFVTEDGAAGRLDFDLCHRRIDEVAVFSDGIERLVLHDATRSVFAPFFDKMFPAVRALNSSGLDTNLSNSLELYLSSKQVCDKTDDDKTLVLATRWEPTMSTDNPVAASDLASKSATE